MVFGVHFFISTGIPTQLRWARLCADLRNGRWGAHGSSWRLWAVSGAGWEPAGTVGTWAMKKTPGCWGVFWGIILATSRGDYFINHEITVPLKQPQGTGWFFVAHMISPSTFVGPSWVFRSLGASPSSTSKAWQPGRFGARCRYS